MSSSVLLAKAEWEPSTRRAIVGWGESLRLSFCTLMTHTWSEALPAGGARASPRIDHPHICRVFEVGEAAGRAYIAMQYVAGRSLDAIAAELSLLEKVQIIHDVAEALHEAHRQE